MKDETETLRVSLDISLTPEQIAEAFWNLDHRQQAEFYACLWRFGDGVNLSTQGHYVAHAIAERATHGDYEPLHGWRVFHEEAADYVVTASEMRDRRPSPEPHPVSSPSKAVDVLAVIDETIRKTEQAAPTPLKRYGESCEHPVHHASRLHDLRAVRTAAVDLIAFARWIAERHDEKSVEGQAARAALSTIGESQ